MNWFRRLFSSKSSQRNAQQSFLKTEKVSIYHVLKLPPPGTPHTPDNILITGSAFRTFNEAGVAQTRFTLHKSADPLTMIELKAGVYWNDSLDREVNTSQAIQWLEAVQNFTSTTYVAGSAESNRSTLLKCLAKLSLHYSICERHNLSYALAISGWFDEVLAMPQKSGRKYDLDRSNILKEFLESNHLPSGLLGHLKRSVS